MLIPFDKYEGLGNDFLVVDERGQALSDDAVRLLCDRHRGVGADGILIVTAVVPTEAASGRAATMMVRNADGSRPEMCGNGLRCVALSLATRRRAGSNDAFVVNTDAGPRACEVRGDLITIDMGSVTAPVAAVVTVDGASFALWKVNLGNPHAVLFEDDTHSSPESFTRFGPQLTVHPEFPEGANVEFVRATAPGSFDVRVWERGVGPTLACGTGACAVAVVACTEGRAVFGQPIEVRLPGGALQVEVSRDLQVRLTGPARRVFSGEVDV